MAAASSRRDPSLSRDERENARCGKDEVHVAAQGRRRARRARHEEADVSIFFLDAIKEVGTKVEDEPAGRKREIVEAAAATFQWLKQLNHRAPTLVDEAIQEAKQHAMMKTGLTPLSVDIVLKLQSDRRYRVLIGAMLMYLDRKRKNAAGDE